MYVINRRQLAIRKPLDESDKTLTQRESQKYDLVIRASSEPQSVPDWVRDTPEFQESRAEEFREVELQEKKVKKYVAVDAKPLPKGAQKPIPKPAEEVVEAKSDGLSAGPLPKLKATGKQDFDPAAVREKAKSAS